MLFHTRSERKSVVLGGTSVRVTLAVAVTLLAIPAAASAQAPVAGTLKTAAELLGTSTTASTARVARVACRGNRRSFARAQAAAVRCLVNRARVSAGLRPLRGSRTLTRAATRHVRDMGRSRFFSHRNMRGRSPAARARAAGWHGRRIGEALAYGCGTSATPMWVLTSWLNSPSHRAIVLGPTFRKMGVGVARKAPTGCSGGKTYALEAGR